MKLKKGDKVIIIAGKNKGQNGAIVRVLPRDNMVLLEGMNLVKKHRKPSSQNRKGQIIDKPMPLHASNVMLLDPKTGKGTRIKITRDKDGNRQRVAVKSGEELK
ncbi:50S ribosomal protein L24 [Candidatus Kaiserbacteria bacterium CG10_big_fil_rev_8_21_14_0_10_51_14]|uniref:Large ribosomal subunit protein uL24 n=1 Tax=Candidatus Kaiserbacteria bacterium CG10_big_fil_rev_8_21_14_0_10_51_14 TaxID=1974610 RepID=A0A2H0UDV3_9BACT|nr:MAG: 50S ribosomal protein L24 [Candidatus Kaiserbacteria bacterium CG10_big_fil_rev_8_21_14_0_10_51_14]